MTNATARKPVPFPAPVGSRVFPPEWTAEIGAKARADAHAVAPEEAVGIVTGGKYRSLKNVSPKARDEVGLATGDLVNACHADVFFHSHPTGPACPSEHDMRFQEDINRPCVIYDVVTNDMFAWGAMLDPPPLVGRAFRHGVTDCYALVRDYYQLELGQRLRDQPRAWDWWAKGQDLYEEHFASEHFRKIPVSEATEKGDLILFRFNFKVLMHAAIVTSPDLLLHHTAGRYPYDPSRISGYVPRARYIRHAAAALRRCPP